MQELSWQTKNVTRKKRTKTTCSSTIEYDWGADRRYLRQEKWNLRQEQLNSRAKKQNQHVRSL